MLLAIDVGNTDIVMGIYDNEKLVNVWRMATNKERSSDEFGVFFLTMLNNAGTKLTEVDSVIISSVVPNLIYSLTHSIEKYFNVQPILVEPGIKTGLNIKIDNPKELGADLIADAVAALELYGGPLIIIDFGTATTFSAVNSKNEHLGVVICLGVRLTAEALTKNTAKLPNIQIKKPDKVIGKNTVDSMQSGLVYGYVGKIDYLVNKIKDEMAENGEDREKIKVIATGGMARIIANEAKSIDEINGLLTLEGLRVIYERNKPANK
ncbi:MAG: type III pantothenate kinase [Clostridia bacterium]